MKIKNFFLVLVALVVMPAVSANVEAAEPQKKEVKTTKAKVSGANVFNRLLKKEKQRNAAPPEDGIHDASNDSTHVLQPPLIAYDGLPTTDFGNYVDWVKALDTGLLKPRYDRFDPTIEPLVMNLEIIREAKSSMPDVMFPHKAHTQWLDCSNCHPKIFIPQRNANVMSMSAILLGQQCGVCHGKVSFPVTTNTCVTCHSKAKPADWKTPESEISTKNPWR
jgi:c(7)-type cytochrome triheme protein